MNIEKINVMPVQDSVNPELLFEIEFLMQRGYEIPIEITGSIFSDENKKIANIYEMMHGQNRMELSARNNERNDNIKIVIKLIASLNYKVLDYIETRRTKNPKGDVVLNSDIFVKTLNTRTVLSTLELGKLEGIQGLPNDSQSVFYRYRPKFSTQVTNMWILSGDGNPTFIDVQNNNFKEKVIIRSSDWIHDYCPVFQIGKFSVFEYLLPDYTKGSGSIDERLNESINAIKKMEENMIEGDWNGVIENSRAVWELLRNQDEIKALLMGDGYSQQAFDDLNESFKKLFDFASKFIHKLDKDKKKTMPDLKASKEDAYLIYATSMNVVNLISKKMQRLKSINP